MNEPGGGKRSGDRVDSGESVVKAEHVLSGRQEVFGALYLISLKDLFAVLGGRSSRMDEAVRMICKRAIDRHLGGDDGVEMEQEDFYIFRIPGVPHAQGWVKARAIVDEVGVNVLGERYIRSETDPMIRIAVVDAALVCGGNGLNADMIECALEKVRGKSHSEIFRDWEEFIAGKNQKPKSQWIEFNHAGRKSGGADSPSENGDIHKRSMKARNAAGRRRVQVPFRGPDRRQQFDRRGRGY